MARTIGTLILLVGLAATLYGTLAFFVFNGMPPNSNTSGRLPSLYLIFAGMLAMLVGTAIRGLGMRKPRQ